MQKVVAVGALCLAIASASPILDARSSKFTFYNLITPASGPCDLAVGPDGALWGEDILVDKLFRIDPHTHAVTEYPIPFTTPFSNQTVIPGVTKEVQDRVAFSCAIRNGTDGNIYASNGLNNQLVQMNPRTKQIKVFGVPPTDPLGNAFPFNDLYSAETGIWFTQTTGNVFNFFDFKTEQISTVKVPTPNALPLGTFVASNGIVYIAELVGNKIIKYNPQTKVLKEYPLPVPAQFPAVIRAEREGYVYFSLFIGNGIGRINMANNDIELYHTNQTGLLGSEDTIDSSGGVWLSSFTTDVMSRLDTQTLQFSYVALPNSFASGGGNGIAGDVPPYLDIAVNYGPGNAIWFTSLLTNQVGRYSLD